mmetsp:Transcript_62283/g.157393  ORF Transcript_62283/g.157393 Transcript_62283/m.157393 type:complete len:113 (+) Transcript_62283:65-403(+)
MARLHPEQQAHGYYTGETKTSASCPDAEIYTSAHPCAAHGQDLRHKAAKTGKSPKSATAREESQTALHEHNSETRKLRPKAKLGGQSSSSAWLAMQLPTTCNETDTVSHPAR